VDDNKERRRRYLRLPHRSKRVIENEIDDEFRFHLEMRERELRARGMSESQARQEALHQFGDLGDAREYCRTADESFERANKRGTWLDEVRQDIHVAWRQMRHSPRFAFGATLTLAIGVAVATAAYSLVHAYLVRPLPYPDPERLAYIIAGPSRAPFPNAPSLQPVDWTPVDSIFDGTVAWDLDGFTLAGGERPEYVDGAWVSKGYFAALGIQPAVGRGFGEDEYTPNVPTPVALISDALWARRYNRDPGVVGSTIRAHSTDRPRESELITVVGVMPANSWHITRFTDVIRPLTTPRMPSMARLKSGSTLAQSVAQLNAVVLPQLNNADPTWKMSAVPVQDEYTYDIRPTLVALFGAAAFMLLIAAGSVAGALVARGATRRSELGIRGALGASRARLVRQLLTESLVLAVLAAALGTVLARLLIDAIGTIVSTQLGVGVPGGAGRLVPGATVFLLALVAATALGAIFGLVPAIAATKMDLAASVRSGRGTGSSGRAVLRQTLIAGQIALTVVLLVGAGLMLRTVQALRDAPLGFRTNDVIKADMLLPLGRYPDAAARRDAAEHVLTSLRALPGVRSAALVMPYPFRQGPTSAIGSEGSTASQATLPQATVHTVTTDYFKVMDVALLSGRAFDDRDNADVAPVAIISDGLAARLWPNEAPIGRRIRVGEGEVWHTVVGVTRETLKTVVGERSADVYVPFAQSPRAYTSIVVRTAPGAVVNAFDLQRTIGQVDDVLALSEISSMDEIVAREGAPRRVLAALLGAFSIFALGLALLALYSAISYVVAQRSRELAIRIAIGANGATIMRLVVGEGVTMVLGGVLAGVTLSLAVSRILTSQVYGVATTDVMTFGAIIGVVAIAALSALALPARRAMLVDPAAAMRTE
jgi:predicted permease